RGVQEITGRDRGDRQGEQGGAVRGPAASVVGAQAPEKGVEDEEDGQAPRVPLLPGNAAFEGRRREEADDSAEPRRLAQAVLRAQAVRRVPPRLLCRVAARQGRL